MKGHPPPDDFKGKQGADFFWKLRESNSELNDLQIEIEKEWKREIEKLSGLILRTKNEVLRHYSREIKVGVTKDQLISTVLK